VRQFLHFQLRFYPDCSIILRYLSPLQHSLSGIIRLNAKDLGIVVIFPPKPGYDFGAYCYLPSIRISASPHIRHYCQSRLNGDTQAAKRPRVKLPYKIIMHFECADGAEVEEKRRRTVIITEGSLSSSEWASKWAKSSSWEWMTTK
jgi:hypothetical protein